MHDCVHEGEKVNREKEKTWVLSLDARGVKGPAVGMSGEPDQTPRVTSPKGFALE